MKSIKLARCSWKPFLWPVLLLHCLGIATCIYLVSISFTHEAQLCQLVGSDCAAVITSKYGRVLGFSVSSIGLGYYVCQLLFALVFSFSAPKAGTESTAKRCFAFCLILNSAAVAASCYFIFLLTFVLNDSCAACIIVHVINITSLILNILICRRIGKECTVEMGPLEGSATNGPLSLWSSVLLAIIVFLMVNLYESRFFLKAERLKTSGNLQYAFFAYDQAERFTFDMKPGDQVFGSPEDAVHQVVLIYKDGCSHCKQAQEKLLKMVSEYEMAIYLIVKNYTKVGKARLNELKVERVPAVFINGQKADGWELPGYMERFTEDCGC